jgi:hypothetical protein
MLKTRSTSELLRGQKKNSQQAAMPSSRCLLLLCLWAAVAIAAAPAAAQSPVSPYEILVNYGLPGGLIPENVNSSSYDPTTRFAEVFLNDSCTVDHGSFRLDYEPKISYSLFVGAIYGVKGVDFERNRSLRYELTAVRALPGTEYLEFVGGANRTIASAPASKFATPPACSSPRLRRGAAGAGGLPVRALMAGR